jgi:aspartate/methionine/tyrosine aminotransferase
MTEAERLNAVLTRDAPAAARCLSDLGRRAAFPRGIPFQTGEARKTEYNATIGQVTDGRGNPLPLDAMAAAVPGLDPKIAFLYAPQEGHAPLREAWGQRQRLASLGSTAPASLPMVVHGLTQGVSLVADAFADAETDVVIPDPCWENYELLFQFRPHANLVRYPFYKADGSGFDVDGFADVLSKLRRKSVIVLNFPANPAGYAPTVAEARAITEVLLAHKGPSVVLFDDAYQGLVFEDGLAPRSLYWDVAERCDPERLFPIKTDGATKELFFFGGRVAFLSARIGGEAEDAVVSKWKCIARSTVGVAAGPSQAMVLAALRAPDLDAQIDARLDVLRSRYRTLKHALGALPADRARVWPFNAGVFALVGLDPSLDADVFRKRLIADFSVGTISIPSANAVRIAYCSVEESALGELADRVARALR